MQLRHWIWLFLAQSAWASGYVAMKVAGDEMPVGAVVFLRYGAASLGFLAAGPFLGLPRIQKRDLGLVFALGALNFALAPTLQISSLRYTQAIDVSILIALEPMMTVLLAALAIRERPTRATLLALAAGTLGMIILSGAGFGGFGEVGRTRLFGNALFVASLFCEASVTVAGRRLAARYPPSQVIFAMKVAGFLTASLVFAGAVRSTDFGAVTWRGWSSVLFLALLSSIFAYTVWYRVIRVVPVSHVALSLFFQPLVGTVIGYSLLGEEIGLETLAGAALVCVSLAWWHLREAHRRPGYQSAPSDSKTSDRGVNDGP